MGTVYLLHFEKPFRHARHYLGYVERDLEQRMRAHAAGRGARLLAAVAKAGIEWGVARIWNGDRALERRLKNLGGAARVCPVCRPENKAGLFLRAFFKEHA